MALSNASVIFGILRFERSLKFMDRDDLQEVEVL
jgi:hypothetical protein